MIDEKTIPLNYIKKRELPGSDRGIRFMFRAEEKEENEEKVKVLVVYLWPEPYGFAATDPSLIRSKEFPLSDEGRLAGINWINEERDTL